MTGRVSVHMSVAKKTHFAVVDAQDHLGLAPTMHGGVVTQLRRMEGCAGFPMRCPCTAGTTVMYVRRRNVCQRARILQEGYCQAFHKHNGS